MNMNTASFNTLDINALALAIAAIGNKRTVMVQGDMGSGKSSISKLLADPRQFPQLDKHVSVYCDCTTKDLGDLTIPKLKDLDGNDFVRYATNEELGLHLKNTPITLMIDEYGKANAAVKNALLRLMLERKMGAYTLHPDSIVFCTTNLGAEGVGDILPPHARNRMVITRMRKSNNKEWLEWGIDNAIHPSILGWANETPQLFQSFTDVRDPKASNPNISAADYARELDEANPYIYHPKAPWRTSFVTPRSLEAASDILWAADKYMLDKTTVLQLLLGTLGERGARDLMAFVTLADDLPKLQQIKDDPMNAKVPESAAAMCMVVYRTLATIEYSWVSSWMRYMARLPRESQGLFINGVRKATYPKRDIVAGTKEFGDWCIQNGWMYSADKK
jgi:hypothetical protein